MKTFKSLFPMRTWEKGNQYYESGKIKKFQGSQNTFSAVVSGTRDYRVSIILNHDEVTWMSCTCPHALSGNNCKHMAAVLSKIENEKIFEADKKDALSEVQIIFKRYTNRSGSISRNQEIFLFNALDRYLDNIKMDIAHNREHIAQIQWLCRQLDHLIMEADDLKNALAIKCGALLCTYAQDKTYQNQITSWVEKQCKDVTSRVFAKIYIQVLISEYDQENYIKINQLISNNKNNQLITSKLLEEKITLMRAINKTETAIYEEIKGFENYEVVFDYLLSYYESAQQYIECSKMIVRLLNKGNLSMALRNKYIDKLNNMALLSKDKKAYEMVVKRQLQSWRVSDDKEIMINYRNLFDFKEWEKVKHRHFDEWRSSLKEERYLNILVYLNEMKELFAFFLNQPNHYWLLNYVEYLEKFDEEALAQLYFEIINHKMVLANNKAHYLEIIDYLKRVSLLQEGKIYLDDILLYLKHNYLRRKSFIELLNEFEQEMDEC